MRQIAAWSEICRVAPNTLADLIVELEFVGLPGSQRSGLLAKTLVDLSVKLRIPLLCSRPAAQIS